MRGSLSRELNEIFYTLYGWSVAAGLGAAARYVALVVFASLVLVTMAIILGVVAHFADATSYPPLTSSRGHRAMGGLAAVLAMGSYYGFATPDKIAFLESDYSDETPREARRRQVRVTMIIVLLVFTLSQTLRLLIGR